VVVIPSTLAVATLEAVIDPGVETGPVLAAEIDPEAVTGLAQAVEIDLEVVTNQVQVVAETDPVPEPDQVRDRNQAQVAVTDPVPEQDQARDKNQVQVHDPAQEQDRVRATRVPLVAREGAVVLHQGTVNVVHPVVPANHAQEVHRAEVVVDAAVPVVVVDVVVAVAEAVAADVDVDLRWRLKTPKQPHRTIE